MIQKLFFCFILFIFGSGNFIFAQDREHEIHLADSILEVRGEVYFSFSQSFLNSKIERFISIENIKKSLVFAYANKNGFNKFLDLNIDFKLQPENFLNSRLKTAKLATPDSIYPSYPHYLDMMQKFEKDYSSVCKLYNAGFTVQGRNLLMLKISAPLNYSDSRPAVLLTSSIHGNELTGYKLLLNLADYLLQNYGKDELVTKLLDHTEIWINPLANPDGTYFGGDLTVLPAKRFNANNLDLNRNFPDPAEGAHPDGSEWQPETVAMMVFYKQKKIVLSANFHTGEEVVNYPWDTWSHLHPDNHWYKDISRQYVDLAHQKKSSYFSGFDNGIVNGYFWYRITGGRQDYVNYFLGGREVTVELSENGMPDSVSMQNYWNYNLESLLYYIERSLFGVRGRVTDEKTSLPLKAKVVLMNHDKENSWVFSDSINGEFNRLLAPGDYEVLISAPGYDNYIQQISLQAKESRYLTVALEPMKEQINIYPNPFKRIIILQINHKILPDNIKVSLIDLSGKVLYVTTIVNAGSLVTISLPQLPDGFYLLRVQSQNFSKQFEIIKMD